MTKILFLLFVVAASVLVINGYDSSLIKLSSTNWEQAIVPGALSVGHEFLIDDCESCHSPIQGVERDNCVLCHANDSDLLQRQPTYFHAEIGECTGCHLEHQGREANISTMDHSVLAEIGLDMLGKLENPDHEGAIAKAFFDDFIRSGRMSKPLFMHASITSEEALLQCATCHENDDRHFTLFGQDCEQCHRTDQWSLSEFQHPSSQSRDCNQCHEAPPSHYMPHFKMISATVAGQPKAPVEDCFSCHQNTSWNDIKRVGLYKHH